LNKYKFASLLFFANFAGFCVKKRKSVTQSRKERKEKQRKQLPIVFKLFYEP